MPDPDAVVQHAWRWPRRCLLCGAWGGQALCPPCLARFASPRPRCPRCALALPQATSCGNCLREPPPFDAAIAAADYGFPWDRLIADFKFHGQPELARTLGEVLLDALRRHGGAPRVQAIVPVPLSDARLAERGYNQAWELARRLGRALRVPALPEALLRLHDTPHQVGLSRQERLANLRDAFWVPPEGAALLRGREVALVDDVLTTGATAALASQALLRAGAARVTLWVLARTPPPGD